MNTNEAEHVLRLRLDLTEARYSKTTVEAWAGSLDRVPQAEVTRAMRALAAQGEHDISPAAVHGWLREQRAAADRAEKLATMNDPTPDHDPGCTCQRPQPGLPQGAICDMHRQRGLNAIAHIRAQRGAHRPVDDPNNHELI